MEAKVDPGVSRAISPPQARRFSLGRVRRALFGISADEASFARRGFAEGVPATQAQLEQCGRTFVHGYLAALSSDGMEELAEILEAVPTEFRGFAYEGAGMGLTLLDFAWAGKGRLPAFLRGVGERHRYMAMIGAGWAHARLGKRVPGALVRLDPLLAWLAADGFGFHEGYFHHEKSVNRQRVPRKFKGYERRVFDQGLGRSLLFVCSGDVARVGRTIAGFDAERAGDLWSGVGLAAAYAGAMSGPEVAQLATASGPHLDAFAQGVAFAAEARELAGNPIPATEEAVRRIWGVGAPEVAALVRRIRTELRVEPDDGGAAYEDWRARIGREFRAARRAS